MEILDERVLVWLENAQFVKAKPGVYVLYDKNLDAIYIGESENLSFLDTGITDHNENCLLEIKKRGELSSPRSSFCFSSRFFTS